MEKGATPLVLSPVPRNNWKDGKVLRAAGDYGLWAREAAEQAGAVFIDFNSALADRFEEIGAEATAAIFVKTDHTHTSAKGAEFNAKVLAQAIRELPDCKLAEYQLPEDLRMPAIFSNHIVVQSGLPLPVWGSGRSGEDAFPAAPIRSGR